MPDRQTVDLYDSKAGDYAEVTANAGKDPGLAAFLAALPAGARVLDLGCGPGIAAAAMARHGCVVEAIDASAEMVALAARHPDVAARQASFDDLDADCEYDGVWANFSLLHAPRSALPGHLAAIHRALKPGGLLHIAVKAGTGEKRDALGRFYTYYTLPELKALLEQAGFRVTGSRSGRDKGLDGALSDWISLSANA